MKNEYWILEGHTPVPADLMTWARWFEKADRKVARTVTPNGSVSTVFLGADHRFGGGPLEIFETMVFDGPLTDEIERYATWEEAEAGHARMVARVEAASENGGGEH